MINQEMITISKEDYDELIDDSNFLQYLMDYGLDNWIGYYMALEAFQEEQNEVRD